MSAWILTIGDELLAGRVINWNAYWIAKRLTSVGIKVRRILCIPDDKNEIISEIHNAFRSGANIIFTTGGLGPTPGDITLEAISEAIGRPLELNDDAKKYIEKRYQELYELGVVTSPELNESRLKMAKIPAGANVVYNDVGVAPAVIVRLTSDECKLMSGRELVDCIIISLPGVPSEAMYLFEKIVITLRGEKVWIVEDYVDVMDESKIVEILKKVRAEFPQVSIKTYPIGFGQQRMKVISIATSEELARRALNYLKKQIKEMVG